MGFGLVIGFIEHLLIVTTSNCNTVTSSHTLQFTTARMKSFQFLKICASLISHPLTHICSQSLFTGIIPDCLKISVVMTTVQKGEQN
jgi:hypothetical protein